MASRILIVRKKEIFPEKVLDGFAPLNEDLLRKISLCHKYGPRNHSMEHNTDFLQIIPQLWLIDKNKEKVFFYQGTGGREYAEKGQSARYIGGIGGHVYLEGGEPIEPISNAIKRYSLAGLTIDSFQEFRLAGLVHNEDNLCEMVHLGAVALADISEEGYSDIKENGVSSGEMCHVSEVEKILERKDVSVDSWTRASWPFVKNHLMN